MRGSDADAEDAFGKATLAMVNSAPGLTELRSPAAWLGEVVRNACIDTHRENARRREETLHISEYDGESVHELHFSDEHLDPERLCLHRESIASMLRAVDALPPHLRTPLLLRAEEDMSYADMAHVLFDSEENLRKRVQVARQTILASLENDDEPCAESAMAPVPTTLLAGPIPGPIRFIQPIARSVETPSGRTDRTEWLPLATALPRYVPHRAEALRQYVGKHPRGWRKRILLADMLLRGGRLEEAVMHYQAVVARRPGHWEAWTRLASALQYAGHADDAAEVLDHLENASATVEIECYYRGLSLLARGKTEPAQENLLCASRSKSCPPALSTLAVVHASRGRHAEAFECAHDALEADPHDIQALLIAHDATSSLEGRTAHSEQYLERALAVAPDCIAILLRLFEHARRGAADSNRLMAISSKLRRLAPELPEVQHCMGDLRHSQRRGARVKRI